MNNEKSNVFIMGHIVLECCLLEKVNNIFDYDTFEINVTLLNDLLFKKLNRLVSDSFIKVLTNMLSLKPENRPSFKLLLSQLKAL